MTILQHIKDWFQQWQDDREIRREMRPILKRNREVYREAAKISKQLKRQMGIDSGRIKP